jgi:hypothetical protein
MAGLADYRRSVYSQNGEDGVLAEVFRRLPSAVPRWYVEFGAWDGKYGSNCYALALQGWRGVMIEGDRSRFTRLEQTSRRVRNTMIAVREFIESGPHLEQILSTSGVPHDFGLLSIDIDSFDYDIWKGMELYRPAVVVIEIDSSTAPGVHRVWSGEPQPATTFTSMAELGQSKDYSLVCHTGNLIFVRKDLIAPFEVDIPAELNDLFITDWMDPSRLQVWRRKLRWFTRQRAMCKVEEMYFKLRS